MGGLVAIDVVAALFFTFGFILAFKPGVFRSLGRGDDRGVSEDAASAFRIGGVMIMAFSVTLCLFINLIAYYSARSATAGH